MLVSRAFTLRGEWLEDRCLLSATVFEHNQVAYFLAEDEARIDRYSITSETWLSPIELSGDKGPPTVGHVDDDGIYLAYDDTFFDSVVYRYDLDGDNEIHILDVNRHDVIAIHSDGNLLFVNYSWLTNGGFTSINKMTNTVIDMETRTGYARGVHGSSIAPGANRIIGRSQGVAPSDITYIEYTDAGEFTFSNSSPYHGDFPDASRTWIYPNGAWLADDSGTVYRTGTLLRRNNFATRITAMDFHRNQLPVLVHGTTLTAFDAHDLPTGSIELDHTPSEMFVNSDSAITFTKDTTSPTGYEAHIISLNDLQLPKPTAALDPEGRTYFPHKIELVGDGTMLMFNKSLKSIFRWDAVEQRYVDSIRLIDEPNYMAYSRDTHTVYLAYDSGLIRKIDFSAPDPTEVPFAILPWSPVGLAAVGPYLFAIEAEGSFNASDYLFRPDGTLVETQDSVSQQSDEFVWSDANQKLYYLTDYRQPTSLVWKEINEDGSTYPNLDAGEFGAYHESRLNSYNGGFRHPVRVSPDGSVVLLGSGVLHDAITLDRLPTSLGNSISDATWLDGKLYTVRTDNDVTQYQRWTTTDYTADLVVSGTNNRPRAMMAVPEANRLVSITMPPGGGPHFDVFDANLQSIAKPVPVAIAGDDTLAFVDVPILLDGSSSFDGDNGPGELTFQWTVVSGPSGGSLTDAGSATTQFFAAAPGQYELKLTVFDGQYSSSDTLLVSARRNSWHNQEHPRDVDANGTIAPQDVVIIINELLTRSVSADPSGELSAPVLSSPYYYDVDEDNFVTATDAIQVINALASMQSRSAPLVPAPIDVQPPDEDVTTSARNALIDAIWETDDHVDGLLTPI